MKNGHLILVFRTTQMLSCLGRMLVPVNNVTATRYFSAAALFGWYLCSVVLVVVDIAQRIRFHFGFTVPLNAH